MLIRSERTKQVILVILGGIIAAVGLQFFLLPNHLVDGGVTGLSIIVARLTGLPLGIFLVLLNIPFIILAHKKFGKGFATLSVIGILVFASLTFIHIGQGATDTPILAAVFGGAIVGVGAGLVLRYGGILDGSDTIAVLIDRNTVFSVGEAILVINGIIISLAGFVFGWEQAMYSLIAYFVVHKTVDVTVQGLDESRILWIVSLHPLEVGTVVNDLVHAPVTYVKGKGSYNEGDEPYGIMFVVLTRLDERKVQAAVRAVDKQAFMVMTDAHEPTGRVSSHSLPTSAL